MKVALLFSGLVRTLEYTWPTTLKYFGQYAPDVYYYLNETDKKAKVEGLLHPKAIIAEPDPLLPEHNYHTRLGPGLRAVQNDLRQLYGLMRVNQLCRESGIDYQWIVRIRPDLEIIREPEPFNQLNLACIYIPKINNWFGYSD